MRSLLFAALISCWSCQATKQPTPQLTFFIGTYTQHEGHVDGKGDGIYRMTFDPTTLELRVTDTIKGMTNPSFLALSDDQSLLYAVNEIGPGGSSIGQLEAYSIDRERFGKKVASISTKGYAPCHIAVNKNMAVVSNYVAGVVAVVPLPFGEKDTIQNHTTFEVAQRPSPARGLSPPQCCLQYRWTPGLCGRSGLRSNHDLPGR